ncbi:MAG: cyanophycinase [Planctomycetes bacterium]|nr:cyanophycinase [Planctomycetota bacterium]
MRDLHGRALRSSGLALGLVLCLALTLGLSRGTAARAPGALVVVGGGGTPPEAIARALELAGGARAVVAVLPHASNAEDRGLGSAEMFLEAGAAEALVLDDLTATRTRAELERATLVWMPGGSQNALMEALDTAGLVDVLRALHARGVVFGGTSAGAAVMSARMLTGEAELEAVRAGGTELAAGLGLWPGVIVDQHALRRRRLQRLWSAVLDHPDDVGVAIDERTAVVVRGTRFEVVGRSNVAVFDARHAEVSASEPGDAHAARGVALHLLRAGMELDLAREE